MLALWSQSSIAAHFAFCFTGYVVMLAFWLPSTAAHLAFCFTSCDQEWHQDPGWNWPAVEVLKAPWWFVLLAILGRWSRC